MAHAESNKTLIWKVFGILTIITLIEVVFGIYKPKALFLHGMLGTSFLNWMFLILTLVKAYFIAWYFMHLKYEKKWLRRSVVWTLVVYILYLAFYVLYEGMSLGDPLHSLSTFN
jgi:hypothetical protein